MSAGLARAFAHKAASVNATSLAPAAPGRPPDRRAQITGTSLDCGSAQRAPIAQDALGACPAWVFLPPASCEGLTDTLSAVSSYVRVTSPEQPTKRAHNPTCSGLQMNMLIHPECNSDRSRTDSGATLR